VLRRAVELGINLIDTADAYGPKGARSSSPRRYIPIRTIWTPPPKVDSYSHAPGDGTPTAGRSTLAGSTGAGAGCRHILRPTRGDVGGLVAHGSAF
jgi:hypothetical protein